MAKSTGTTEIQKLEKKLANIESGKWNESPERVLQLKARLKTLKKKGV